VPNPEVIMRRPLLALTLVAVALAASACSASTAPGWTYAPPTPSPSAAPSSAASAPASAAPSGGASAAPSDGGSSAAPSGGTDGTVVQISAMGIAFEQTEVSAPADVPFTIHFNNKEAVPHNVNVKDGTGASAFKGDIVTGPIEVDYQVPALTAGSYTFVCDVHPNMTGTLKVGG
jgi:plastocyanin